MKWHTMGPWRFNDYGEIICGPEDDELRIAELAPWEKRHISEMTANARLIAAAPDMLTALNGMLTFYGMNEDSHHETQRAVHNAARAAIAKAKGFNQP